MRISILLMTIAGSAALSCATQVDPVLSSPELESVESPIAEEVPDATPASPPAAEESAEDGIPEPSREDQLPATEERTKIAGLMRRAACAVTAEVRTDLLESRNEVVNGTRYYRPKRLASLEVRELLRGGAACPDSGELLVRYPYHAHSLRIQEGRTYLFVLSGVDAGVGVPLYDADHSAVPITVNGLVQGLNVTPQALLAEEAVP
jgi:hypothetical protein